MKNFKYIILGIVLMLTGTVQAQISVNVAFGSPPLWGPAGYNEVRYYYLPDVEAYYDIQSSMFIYNSGGRWVHRRSLPSRYRNYDLYGGYKVVMTDYRGNTPYYNYNDYRIRYARGYHGQVQRNIGERPGNGNSRRRIDSRSNSNRGDYNQNSKGAPNQNKNIKKSRGNGREKGK